MMEKERIILLIAVETTIQLMRILSCAVSSRLKEKPRAGSIATPIRPTEFEPLPLGGGHAGRAAPEP
jgi:hypothetical protein